MISIGRIWNSFFNVNLRQYTVVQSSTRRLYTFLICFVFVFVSFAFFTHIQETVEKLCSTYDLSEEFAVDAETHPAKHRNIATILGCLAEKLAGPKSIEIMKCNVLKYLLANLVS